MSVCFLQCYVFTKIKPRCGIKMAGKIRLRLNKFGHNLRDQLNHAIESKY